MGVKILYSTFPSVVSAEAATRRLVEARLAACGNILPALVSIYEWQGKLERSEEVILLLKTTAEKASALMEALRQEHPYEVPAILLLPVEEAGTAFAAWVVEQTGG